MKAFHEKNKKLINAAIFTGLLLSVTTLKADVRLAALFCDGMVLQRGMVAPVWGWGDPGEEVKVMLNGQEVSGKVDGQGKWLVRFQPMDAGGPFELTVRGKNSLVVRDVYLGEVWLASGQSNMDMPANEVFNAVHEAAEAKYPLIRTFIVGKTISSQPQEDCQGKWIVCEPATYASFPAVGYFFARELHRQLKIPVGIIHSAWGGTGIYGWSSRESLMARPESRKSVERLESSVANFARAVHAHADSLRSWLAAADQAKAAGKALPPTPFLGASPSAISPGSAAAMDSQIAKYSQVVYDHAAELRRWLSAADQAKADGKPIPAPPILQDPRPGAPKDPRWTASLPCLLYNGMIAPLVPCAIRGVIWYQGESNATTAGAPSYRTLFSDLIRNWRQTWGEGDFPFLFVQLASYNAPPAFGKYGWPMLREAQAMALKLPNTGMAVALDIGDARNIHPRNKQEVGRRLALWALNRTYGQACACSGPLYDGAAVEGGKMRIRFKHVEGGLAIGTTPAAKVPTASTAPAAELEGFAIAGEDQTFVPAKAKIENDTVVVWSDTVAHPVAVRYGFASNPVVNLFNKENLPAAPFRTDDWELNLGKAVK